MADQNGGSRVNFYNGTVWDDTALRSPTQIEYSRNGVAAVLRPLDPFSQITGDPNGDWTLVVFDNLSIRTGVLHRWTIDLNCNSSSFFLSFPPSATDCFFLLLLPPAASPCASDPCQNGAACMAVIEGFACDCLNGFEGDICDIG